jgi:hypothetical protein
MKYKCRKFKEGEKCPLVGFQKPIAECEFSTDGLHRIVRRVIIAGGFTYCTDHACYLRKRKKYSMKNRSKQPTGIVKQSAQPTQPA